MRYRRQRFATPAYGPKWRHKLVRMSAFLWHLRAIHEPEWHRSGILVAPWNYPRRPIRRPNRRRWPT